MVYAQHMNSVCPMKLSITMTCDGMTMTTLRTLTTMRPKWQHRKMRIWDRKYLTFIRLVVCIWICLGSDEKNTVFLFPTLLHFPFFFLSFFLFSFSFLCEARKIPQYFMNFNEITDWKHWKMSCIQNWLVCAVCVGRIDGLGLRNGSTIMFNFNKLFRLWFGSRKELPKIMPKWVVEGDWQLPLESRSMDESCEFVCLGKFIWNASALLRPVPLRLVAMMWSSHAITRNKINATIYYAFSVDTPLALTHTN